MWDIFNIKSLKNEVQELEIMLRNKNSELKKKNEIIQTLNDDLAGLKTANKTLTEEVELNQKSLDLVLAEFKEFLIHNKDLKLNYDKLDLTSQLIEDFADVNEYEVAIVIDFRESSAKGFKRRFETFLSNSEKVKSFRFQVNQAIMSSSRNESYKAYAFVYSIHEFHIVVNEILSFLYKRKVNIESNNIENDKILTIKGSIR